MLKDPIRATMLCALLSFPTFLLLAQPTYVAKYGKISRQELEMTSYDPEPGAGAVILFDKGRFDSRTGVFTRHTRIKILSVAGLSLANFTVRTPAESAIDGISYNLVHGVIQESELKGENIFKERITGRFNIFKVFFPNVKVGTVLELKYSFDGMPYSWWFQNTIPVMHSEIILEPALYVEFQKQFYGSVPLKQTNEYTWIAEKVPSLSSEPFMNHYSNYVARFDFNITSMSYSSVYSGGIFHFNVAETWDAVAKLYYENDGFSEVFRASGFLNEKARELEKSQAPASTKIDSAFRYVQRNIKWDGSSSPIQSKEWGTNFTKNHTGNSADINLLLTALLQKAGVEAYPMLISTRDNGLLNPTAPSLNGFNYIIAYAKIGDKEMLLDATEPHAIPGILPERCLNISGLVVNKETGWWVDINPPKTNSRKQFIQYTLSEDGTVSAEGSNTYEDYEFLNWVKKFKEHGSEEAYAKAFSVSTTDLEINKCKVTIDPLKLKAIEKFTANLTGSDYVHNLGNEIIIAPFIFNDIDHPFKSEERTYPIDFVSPRSRSIIVSIKIPDSYSVQKYPEDLAIKPETGGAKFTFQATVANNILSIKCNYSIERQVFTELEYASLRHFFSAVTKKLQEPIQLYKKI